MKTKVNVTHLPWKVDESVKRFNFHVVIRLKDGTISDDSLCSIPVNMDEEGGLVIDWRAVKDCVDYIRLRDEQLKLDGRAIDVIELTAFHYVDIGGDTTSRWEANRVVHYDSLKGASMELVLRQAIFMMYRNLFKHSRKALRPLFEVELIDSSEMSEIDDLDIGALMRGES